MSFCFFSSQGDETDKDPEAETESAPPAEQNSAQTSNSLESLYSGQSSSSKDSADAIFIHTYIFTACLILRILHVI